MQYMAQFVSHYSLQFFVPHQLQNAGRERDRCVARISSCSKIAFRGQRWAPDMAGASLSEKK